jgi:hypothetical protein
LKQCSWSVNLVVSFKQNSAVKLHDQLDGQALNCNHMMLSFIQYVYISPFWSPWIKSCNISFKFGTLHYFRHKFCVHSLYPGINLNSVIFQRVTILVIYNECNAKVYWCHGTCIPVMESCICGLSSVMQMFISVMQMFISVMQMFIINMEMFISVMQMFISVMQMFIINLERFSSVM